MKKQTKDTPQIDYPALIDEGGRLEAEIAANAMKAARLKVIKALLAARAVNAPAAESQIYDGSQEYSAVVSAQENETAISDMEAVFRTLGKPKFLSLCSMTLTNLKKALTAVQLTALTETTRTGSRSVKFLKRA